MFVLSIAAFLLAVAHGAKEADKITSLPGFKGDLPSTHYSGYIPVGSISGTAGQLHYWLIESRKEPSTDPIVLWLNGGPGSSSLIGLLTENGQVVTSDQSLEDPVEGVPQLFFNQYSWDAMSNMLFLESPKGVGFSYCEGVSSSRDCVNDDTSTAQDAYEFLVNFFTEFPEYKDRDFYITGESYAGIYIPMLIDQMEQDVLNAGIIKNFKGAAIGNGCWGNTVGTCAFSSPEAQQISAEFYYGHGMFSEVLKKEIDESCGDFNHLSPKCLSALGEMEQQIGNFDVYNIYDECGQDDRRRLRGESPKKATFSAARAALSAKSVVVETADSFSISAGYGEALNGYSCGASTAMDAWLAEPSVIEALNVKAGTPGMQYVKTATDLLPLYSHLIDQYQILIYSGDVDGCVPYVGTEAWTRSLNYTVTNDWHQWFSKPDDVHAPHKAGYAVNFDKFQFVTINGAGHMVPQFQPAYAMTLFKKFLANEEF